jgi:hypothetical protein
MVPDHTPAVLLFLIIPTVLSVLFALLAGRDAFDESRPITWRSWLFGWLALVLSFVMALVLFLAL